MSPDGGDDRGSGTVLALAVIAVVLVLTAALGLLAEAQSARGQAQAAADLAALAGSSRLVRESVEGPGEGGGGPGAAGAASGASSGTVACATAAETARRNGVQMTDCRPEGGGVLRVEASRRSAAGVATARARAGPRSSR